MAGQANAMKIVIFEEYREESVKVPALITMVVLLLISAPLIFWLTKINEKGLKLADISRYDNLVAMVESDTRAVSAILNNDAAELAAINAARKSPVVTLIIPEVVIQDEKKPKEGVGPLNIDLEGVYWNSANPLVGIGGETYRSGDVIQGYEITHIGKTSVQFQAPDGTILVKDMYENLLYKAKD